MLTSSLVKKAQIKCACANKILNYIKKVQKSKVGSFNNLADIRHEGLKINYQ